MKQKIWIFGDSYSDPINNHMPLNPWDSNTKYWDGWSYWLKKDYDVENFAHYGLGADTCFLRLCEKVDKETHDFENISVVFACPQVSGRIVLTGYDKINQSSMFKYLAYPRKEFINIISQMCVTKQQISNFGTLHDRYHEFSKVFITDYMETEEYKNRINMILGALDCYAKHFKRFIFIPVGNVSGWVKTKRENHFQCMTVRDDISLSKLSQQSEFPDDETFKLLLGRASNINGKDIGFLYPNHLDLDNNKIVYDIIKEWMDQVG